MKPVMSPVEPTLQPDKSSLLERIRVEVLQLHESPLFAYRVEHQYFPVIGEGSADACVMLIGEAPGEQEARTGRPFVGASGRLLDELLRFIGLRREEVYITNIVKDRPPNNRDPKKEEIALYARFLERQIAIIQPQVLVTLGRFAMDHVLASFGCAEAGQKISALHGKVIDAEAAYGSICILPLYHPAVALYNETQQQTLYDDIRKLRDLLDRLG